MASGVQGYEIQIDGVIYGSTPGLTLAVTGRSPATPYVCRVRSRDVAGNVSAWSAPLTVTTAAAVAAPAAVLAYAFNEGAGTTSAAGAGSPSGSGLTVVAGNWSATGRNGTALTSAGGRVLLPAAALTAIQTTQRTLAFWAFTPAVAGSEIRFGFQCRLTSADTAAWGIVPRDKDNQSLFRARIGSTNTSLWLDGSSDGWHHYAQTYDGTMLRAYRDGVLVGSQALTGTITAADEGVIADGGGANIIDDLRFYNVALTASQIAAIMAVGV